MRKFTNIVALLLAALLVLPVCAEATQLIPGGQLIGLELEDQTVTIAAFDKTKSVLEEYVVPMDCALIGTKIWELPIPKSAMVVSVVRSGNTLIPDEIISIFPDIPSRFHF